LNGVSAARRKRLRIRDDLAGAEAALDRAELAATARGLKEQRARIHFVRVNAGRASLGCS
jgi:hypothetical protein